MPAEKGIPKPEASAKRLDVRTAWGWLSEDERMIMTKEGTTYVDVELVCPSFDTFLRQYNLSIHQIDGKRLLRWMRHMVIDFGAMNLQLSLSREQKHAHSPRGWVKSSITIQFHGGNERTLCALLIEGSVTQKFMASNSGVVCDEKKPLLETNVLVNMNCIDYMSNMAEASIDLTVTSPPYDSLRTYKGYTFDCKSIAKELFRVTKEGGVVVWVVGDKIIKGNKSLTSFRQALLFQEIGWNVHDVMIYQKKNTPFMRSNGYTNCFEYMFIFSKGKPKTFNPLSDKTVRNGLEKMPANKGPDGINNKVLKTLNKIKTRINIWQYAVGMHGTTSDKIAFEHPAVFPEKLAEDHIRSWSNKGDIVFDPMCGSGTVCKMAILTERKYIGCDISSEYIEIANSRLKKYLGQKKIDDY